MICLRPGRARVCSAPRRRSRTRSRSRATASRVDTWILIEYRGLWAHDAVDGSTLSGELKAHLRAERTRLPHARILFVRRAERRGRDGLLGLRRPHDGERRPIRRLELERHDDLIGVSTRRPPARPSITRSSSSARTASTTAAAPSTAARSTTRCCEQVEDGWAWQSTHVGGDRFAGNLVVLADGVYYGRVEPSEAWPVLEAALDGRVHLPRYRGRSCHGFAAQAAERSVREQTGYSESRRRERALRSTRDGEGWHALRSRPAERPTTSTCTASWARPTHLTCSTSPAQAADALRRRKPSRTSRLTQHEPARVVERARQLGAAERCLGRDEELELGREPVREAEVAALEDERRPVRDRRSRCRAAPARCSTGERRRARAARRAGRRGSVAGCGRSGHARAPGRRRRRASAARAARRRRSSGGRRCIVLLRVELGARLVDPAADVDADRDVQRVGVRGQRLVEPAARQVHRVAGAQGHVQHRLAGRTECRAVALVLQRQLEHGLVDEPALLSPRPGARSPRAVSWWTGRPCEPARRVVGVRLHRMAEIRLELPAVAGERQPVVVQALEHDRRAGLELREHAAARRRRR